MISLPHSNLPCYEIVKGANYPSYVHILMQKHPNQTRTARLTNRPTCKTSQIQCRLHLKVRGSLSLMMVSPPPTLPPSPLSIPPALTPLTLPPLHRLQTPHRHRPRAMERPHHRCSRRRRPQVSTRGGCERRKYRGERCSGKLGVAVGGAEVGFVFFFFFWLLL